jgi:hypothetical protein
VTKGTNVYVSCDGTFKLLHNGWVLLNMILETIVDSDGGIYMICTITLLNIVVYCLNQYFVAQMLVTRICHI